MIKLAREIMRLAKLAAANGYIALRPDKAAAEIINKFMSELGISNLITPSDMHMTLIYDKRDDILAEYVSSDKSYTANITDIKALGEPGSEYYAIAIVFEAPEIALRHKNLIAKGFEHGYDDFVPHMSVKYKPSEDDIAKAKASLAKLKAKISSANFGNEFSESIKG